MATMRNIWERIWIIVFRSMCFLLMVISTLSVATAGVMLVMRTIREPIVGDSIAVDVSIVGIGTLMAYTGKRGLAIGSGADLDRDVRETEIRRDKFERRINRDP